MTTPTLVAGSQTRDNEPARPYERHLPDRGDIPEALLSRSIWGCWTARPRPDGKVDKRPLSPVTGSGAGWTRPENFTDFATARAFAERHPEVTGLGIAVTDGISGIDLDHCRDPESGELSEQAQAILNEAATYAEISPGLAGVRALFVGSFGGFVRAKDGIELYEPPADGSVGRFLTITGRRLADFPLDLRQADLTDLGRRYSDKLEPDPDEPPRGQDIRLADLTLAPQARYVIETGDCRAYRGDRSTALFGLAKDIGRSNPNLSPESIAGILADPAHKIREAALERKSGDESSAFDWVLKYCVKPALRELEKEQRDPDYTPPSVIDLSDLGHIEIRPEPYLLSPIIPRGEVTLLAGNGGSGKSLLALAMGAHVAVGEPWGPFASEGEPRRVLFVSMEDHAQRIRGRLQRITDAYCLDPETLREHFIALDATEAGAIAEEDDRGRGLKFLPLFDTIAEQAARSDLTIIDNASDAFDANENARRQVKTFIKALAHMVRGHGGAVLLLAHLDKTGARYGTAGNSYSGSTAWNNSARSRLALLDGELVHEKANTGKKHPEPIGIEWTDLGVPRPTDRAATRKRNATPTARRAFEALLTAIDGSDRPSADLEAWRGEFYARHEADTQEAKKKAFQRARQDLIDGKAVEVCGDRYAATTGGRWLDLFALVEAWREKSEFFGYLQ